MSSLIPIRETIKRADERRQTSRIRKNNESKNKRQKKQAEGFHKNGSGPQARPEFYAVGFVSRRAFRHSTNIGTTETRMMATITNSKFFCTNGMLPKK